MANLKFCGCRNCKAGRKGNKMSCVVDRAKRRARREVKVDLRLGRDLSPAKAVSVPYTD